MDPLYGPAWQNFEQPVPYDEWANLSFMQKVGAYGQGAFEIADEYGRRQMGLDPLPGRKSQDVGAIFDAAEASSRLARLGNSAELARDDIYDTIAKRVHDATGVQLANPWYQIPENPNRAFTVPATGYGRSIDQPDGRALARQKLEDAFLARARELKAQKPDLLGDLDLDTPVLEQARKKAFAADAEAAKQGQRQDVNPFAQAMAQFGGGMKAAAQNDPLFWAAFLTPGSQAATAPARVIMNGIIQGGTMAALTAAEQPAVQAWRSEIGLKAGFGEAAAETMLAAVMGAVPGLTISAATELAPVMARILSGKGSKGDFDAAAKAGLHINADDAKAAEAARAAVDATNEAFKPPPGVSREAASRGFVEGLAHVENPEAPAPLGAPAVAAKIDDGLAREYLDGVRPGGFDALRRDPEAIASALASDNPEILRAGRLATLADDVLDDLHMGFIAPDHAEAIGGLTGDPATQRALASLMREAKPATLDEARALMTEAIAARNSGETAAAAQGLRPRDASPSWMADGRDLDLFQTLAQAGGLRPDADIRQILDGNPFIPGFGRLMRENGLTADQALITLKEQKFLFEPGDHSAGPRELVPQHLYDLLDRQARGERVYPMDAQPVPTKEQTREARRQWREEDRAEREALSPYIDHIRKTVRASSAGPLDREILRDAARLMREGEQDVYTAWDRAALDHEQRLLAQSEILGGFHDARSADTGALPGWDVPYDARPAPAQRQHPPGAGEGSPGPVGQEAAAGPRGQARPDGANNPGPDGPAGGEGAGAGHGGDGLSAPEQLSHDEAARMVQDLADQAPWTDRQRELVRQYGRNTKDGVGSHDAERKFLSDPETFAALMGAAYPAPRDIVVFRGQHPADTPNARGADGLFTSTTTDLGWAETHGSARYGGSESLEKILVRKGTPIIPVDHEGPIHLSEAEIILPPTTQFRETSPLKPYKPRDYPQFDQTTRSWETMPPEPASAPKSTDPRDFIPFADENGRVSMLTRDRLDAASFHDEKIADILKVCANL